VEHLLCGCGGTPLDLSGVLVVVPTQQAGRRLRQALAMAAGARGTGVLAPQIFTPDRLVVEEARTDVAHAVDAVAAWALLLAQVDLSAFRAVFPLDPPRRDAAWAAGLAQQLVSLQSQLGEHGLDFAAVAEKVSTTGQEPERWQALADLEAAWRRLLNDQGLTDPTAARLEATLQSTPPGDVQRVVVAGVIDPLPLGLSVLERWSDVLPVEIISHGDAADPVYDRWGRADAARMKGRVLPQPASAHLRVYRTIRDAATFVASLAEHYTGSPRTLGVGAIDPRSLKALALTFHSRGLRAHDPAGTSLATGGLGLLAAHLLDLVGDPEPGLIVQLLRHPVVGGYALRQGWVATHAELLTQLDTLLNDHLPADLDSLAAFAAEDRAVGVASSVAALQALAGRLKSEPLAATLRGALAQLLGDQEYDLARDDHAALAEEARQLGELLQRFAEVEERFPRLSRAAAGLVLKRMLQSARRFPERPEGAWDLQGWLELPYEDAPHLVLAGLNEGALPETIRGDPFLPNALRETLGMRGNDDRFRRDQVLLECLLRSRAEEGRVDLIVPRMSDEGDPLQPSRLLFACSDEELVPRAKRLFAELPPPPPSPPRLPAWRLKPLAVRPPTVFSPSALKAYLSCPYRYYLRYVLRMEAVEVGKRELSASTFGDLCHHALEMLGRDAAMRDVTDAAALGRYLEEAFEAEADRLLGAVDAFALKVQLESGRARLAAAAAVEAEQRALGWRIEQVEHPWKLELEGITIQGRIDRIDRNLGTDEYRLIDYKTNEQGKPPEKAHWVRHRPGDTHVLPESIFAMDGAEWRWLDLQLPLYLLAIRTSFRAQASAGYFVLPKIKEETGLRLWEQLTPEHLVHAERCAVAIARAVAARRFWPPAADLRGRDPYEHLFPDGVLLDVDAEAMLALSDTSGSGCEPPAPASGRPGAEPEGGQA
jgi:ATP-dependent helicase/nuclease subunit B